MYSNPPSIYYNTNTMPVYHQTYQNDYTPQDENAYYNNYPTNNSDVDLLPTIQLENDNFVCDRSTVVGIILLFTILGALAISGILYLVKN